MNFKNFLNESSTKGELNPSYEGHAKKELEVSTINTKFANLALIQGILHLYACIIKFINFWENMEKIKHLSQMLYFWWCLQLTVLCGIQYNSQIEFVKCYDIFFEFHCIKYSNTNLYVILKINIYIFKIFSCKYTHYLCILSKHRNHKKYMESWYKIQ